MIERKTMVKDGNHSESSQKVETVERLEREELKCNPKGRRISIEGITYTVKYWVLL